MDSTPTVDGLLTSMFVTCTRRCSGFRNCRNGIDLYGSPKRELGRAHSDPSRHGAIAKEPSVPEVGKRAADGQ